MKKSTKRKITKIITSFIMIIAAILGYLYEEYYLNEENIDNVEMKEVISESELKIYFLDVGQADSILITSNGEYALIDAGNNNDGKKLVNYFNEMGIEKFKYVIGTHAHEDHIGGMDDIIKNFSIEHFYMPNVITTTKTFEDVLDALETQNIRFETPNIDESFSMNDVKFKVLYVGEDKTDLNNSSIVLKVTYFNTTYLLTADATSEVERKILDKELESDVLKVAHHGSGYSSIASFLTKVNPKYAVISVGRNNDYGLPKNITLKKLEKLGTTIYRTDKDGTILLTSDGNSISFETYRTDVDGG